MYITILFQGLMQHHTEIVEYFNTRGVSIIFLFRRNLLRRMISVLANLYDRDAKLLNGTHKSHVHSPHEVSLSLSQGFQHQFFPFTKNRSSIVYPYVKSSTYKRNGFRQTYLQNTSPQSMQHC